jgi:N-acetylglutamate synthase-like GNAT family acetyltransferase
MIRQANKFDIEAIIGLLKQYRESAPLDVLKYANDEEYITQLLSELLAGSGIIFLAEKDGVIIGMLIAAIIPNIWNPKARQCSEVAYWVNPEHRGGTAAYRLIAAYMSECDAMVKQGKIQFYTMTKMVNSPDLKYSKFGFSKLEETWVK